MIPQVLKRQFAGHEIVDLNGPLTGLWIGRIQRQLKSAMSRLPEMTVLNLKHISDIDTLGVKLLSETVSQFAGGILIRGHERLMSQLKINQESVRMINDEQELNEFNSTEAKTVSCDHRAGARVQTALPIKFFYQSEESQQECSGVISNLNENGFYIEYIDMSVEQSLTHLHPQDLNEIHFSISLPNGKLRGRGRVLHRQMNQDQLGVGVQIHELNMEDKKHLSQFLQLQQKAISTYQKGR